MKIPLDRQAKQHIYLQIRDRIHHLIHTGHLPPNSQLPSLRALAQTTQVNKLTVIEAYSVLEADGLVHAKQGAGYFINAPSSTADLTADSAADSTANAKSSCNAHSLLSAQALHPVRSTFNPTQQVILPTGGIQSFPDIYRATIAAHNRPDVVDFGIG
ncbi:MAG: GntR family transcriptional regulator, partial [Phormidesmis sp.]